MRVGMALGISIHSLDDFGPGRSVEAALGEIGTFGFETVELSVNRWEKSLRKWGASLSMLSFATTQRLLERAAADGIRLGSCHAIVHRDTQAGSEVVADHVLAVDFAQQLAMSTCVLHLTAGSDAFTSHPDAYHRAWERDCEILSAIDRYLNESNNQMSIAVENTPHQPLAYTLAIIDSIASPRVGFCFDTGHHSLRCGSGYSGAMVPAPMHLHVNDNNGLFDQHLPAGDGLIPWDEIRSTLIDHNFSGDVVHELEPRWSASGTLSVSERAGIHRSMKSLLLRPQNE